MLLLSLLLLTVVSSTAINVMLGHHSPLTRRRDVVERRVFTVTGKRPAEEDVEQLIETGESETIFQKAILEQGRGQARALLVMHRCLWTRVTVCIRTYTTQGDMPCCSGETAAMGETLECRFPCILSCRRSCTPSQLSVVEGTGMASGTAK
jgi:hypothetical protein